MTKSTEPSRVTKLPPEELRPCKGCGAPILLSLNPVYAPGISAKWELSNRDGTFHDCPKRKPPKPLVRESQLSYRA